MLKELEESKESEVQESRTKLKDYCTVEEAKMERERDEQKKKYEDLKVTATHNQPKPRNPTPEPRNPKR